MKKNSIILLLKKNLWIIIIALGVVAVIYPFASQKYYSYISRQEINRFDNESKNFVNYEIEKKIKLAQAYNQSLKAEYIADPFNDKILGEGRAEYARMLEVHEKIGYIEIPKIGQQIIIKAGTSPTVLQEGAGHLEGTSLPVGGKDTHSVITAHRGLPSAKLFTDLNKLNEGDIFFIKNIKEKLAYKIDKIQTVEPDDFDPVKISLGKDYVSLLTCTPYMINSHRLIVRGHRVNISEGKKIENETNKKTFFQKLIYFIVFIILLLGGFYLFKRIKSVYKKQTHKS